MMGLYLSIHSLSSSAYLAVVFNTTSKSTEKCSELEEWIWTYLSRSIRAWSIASRASRIRLVRSIPETTLQKRQGASQ